MRVLPSSSSRSSSSGFGGAGAADLPVLGGGVVMVRIWFILVAQPHISALVGETTHL